MGPDQRKTRSQKNIMSIKNWLFLLCLYLLYLAFGMVMFHLLECPQAIQNKRTVNEGDWEKAGRIHEHLQTIRKELDSKNGTLDSLIEVLDYDKFISKDTHKNFTFCVENFGRSDCLEFFKTRDNFLSFLGSEEYQSYQNCVYLGEMNCSTFYGNRTAEDILTCEKWNWYNSFFFSFTAVTTIGYGHMAPETTRGRQVCIFYCLLGIPLNLILIGTLGKFFSIKATELKQKLAESPNGSKWEQECLHVWSRVILEGACWAALGTVLFMFIPAIIFNYVERNSWEGHENWNYSDSLYYTFITLSTIGFGDMVPANPFCPLHVNVYERYNRSGIEMVCYNIFIVAWILLGMGYIFMIVNVMSEGLQRTGKPMRKAYKSVKKQTMQYSDYWRSIIGELMVINNWIVDGEGSVIMNIESQPDITAISESEEIRDLRRVKSTGDLHGLDQTQSVMLSPEAANERHKRSTHSLYIPDNGHNGLHIPDTIPELNEDTIHSLREFLLNANRNVDGTTSDWITSNASVKEATSRPAESQSSRKSPMVRTAKPVAQTKQNCTYSDLSDQSDTEFQPFPRAHNSKRRLSRRVKRANSTVSNKSSSSHKITNLLEQTTLAQFLQAAETVKERSTTDLKHSMVNLSEVKQEEITRRRSISSALSSFKSKNVVKYGALKETSPSGDKADLLHRRVSVPSVVHVHPFLDNQDDDGKLSYTPFGRFETRRQTTPTRHPIDETSVQDLIPMKNHKASPSASNAE